MPLTGGGSSDWKSVLYSRGPVNTPNMNPDQFKAFTKSGDYVPNETMRTSRFMKGGRRKTNKRRKSKAKRIRKKKSKNIRRRKSIKTKRYRKKGGGSSDWRSSQYSRGSYIAPNMPLDQFRAFTQTADYMPNESMRSAAFMK